MVIITYWAAVGVDSDKLRFRGTNTGCRMGTMEVRYGANAACDWKQPKGRGADRMKTSGSPQKKYLFSEEISEYFLWLTTIAIAKTINWKVCIPSSPSFRKRYLFLPEW